MLSNKVRQFVRRVKVIIGGNGKFFEKAYGDRAIHGDKLQIYDARSDDCPSDLMNSLFSVAWL